MEKNIKPKQLRHSDADGSDAEYNRRLTEYIKAKAVKADKANAKGLRRDSPDKRRECRGDVTGDNCRSVTFCFDIFV